MKRMFVASVLATLLGLSGGAIAAERLTRLKSGEIFIISNEENPSTGYRWAIDPEASRSLQLLRIEDRGMEPLANSDGRVGAPMMHGWIIHALSSGVATLVLLYQRPWEKTAAKRQRYTFEITP